MGERQWSSPGSVDTGQAASARAYSLSSMINPMLILLAGPVPEFVDLAREHLPEAQAKDLRRAFGAFSVAIGNAVATPLWERHPELSPSFEDGGAPAT